MCDHHHELPVRKYRIGACIAWHELFQDELHDAAAALGIEWVLLYPRLGSGNYVLEMGGVPWKEYPLSGGPSKGSHYMKCGGGLGAKHEVLSSSQTAARPNRPRSTLETPWISVITILIAVIVKQRQGVLAMVIVHDLKSLCDLSIQLWFSEDRGPSFR